MLKNKRIIVLILIGFMSINYGFQTKSFSKEEDINSKLTSNINLEETYDEDLEYSYSYREYQKLSEEQQEQLDVIPRKYQVSFDTLGKMSDNVKDVLPERFNLAEEIDVKVEDQGAYGLCWDFASTKALETNLALNGFGNYDFSELHVDYLMSDEFGNYRKLHEGGFFNDYINYLSCNYGPVAEEEIPYDGYYTIDDYDYLLSFDPEVYVTEIVDFPDINFYKDYDGNSYFTDSNFNKLSEADLEEFRNSVKNHIINYGGLYTSINSPKDFDNYNNLTYAQYTSDGLFQDHAVTIIGWDDNFSRENFLEENRPSKDGAYIVLNSWGTIFGDNGIFYISYEDIGVNNTLSGIKTAYTTKTYKTIKFNDSNLYNTLKNKLDKYILEFNDNSLELGINSLAFETISELELQNSGIKDISGLENFKNLTTLNLSGNPIDVSTITGNYENVAYLYLENCKLSNFDFLNNFRNVSILNVRNNNIQDMRMLDDYNLFQVDLSLNKNMDINSFELNSSISELVLEDCNLTNLEFINKFTNCYNLDISSNKIDISTFNNETIYVINLSNCGISDKDTNHPIFKNASSLNLSHNNITTLDWINEESWGDLDLSYNTGISDVSKLYNFYGRINLSGIKNLTGIEKLKNVYTICLNDCDFTDLGIFKDFTRVETIELDNNNLADISNLLLSSSEKFYTISLNNNNIDVTTILELDKIGSLYLANNNISDLGELAKKDIYLMLDDNSIEKIPENFDKIISFKNNSIEKDIKLMKNRNNRLDFNEFLNYIYPQKYKEDIEIICENCSLDYKNRKVVLDTSMLGNYTAKIKVVGGTLDGSEYKINYEVVDFVKPIELSVIEDSYKKAYLEGENFDSSKLIVKVLYENGVSDDIKDYEIINANNLKKEKDVTVKFENLECILNLNILNESEVEYINLKDENVYNSICDVIEMCIDENTDYLKYNDLEMKIIASKTLIDRIDFLSIAPEVEGEKLDLTGISKLYNLKYLTIFDAEINNWNELENIKELESLSLLGCKITDINDISRLRLKDFTISGKIKTLGNLLEDNDFSSLNVNLNFNEKDLNIDGEKVYLPEAYNQLKNGYEDIKINTRVYYSIDDFETCEILEDFIKYDEKGAYVILDKDITKEHQGKKRLFEIEMYTTNEDENAKYMSSYMSIEYDADKEYEEQNYIFEEEYIINILNKTTKSDFKNIMRIQYGYTIEFIEEELENKNDYIGTGEKVKIVNQNTSRTVILIVTGDINGDGICNALDSSSVKKHRVELKDYILKGAELKAADINHDGKVNFIDSKLLLLHRAEVKGYSLDK